MFSVISENSELCPLKALPRLEIHRSKCYYRTKLGLPDLGKALQIVSVIIPSLLGTWRITAHPVLMVLAAI